MALRFHRSKVQDLHRMRRLLHVRDGDGRGNVAARGSLRAVRFSCGTR